ncbi:MAG: hypothetical protein QOG73_1600 [Acetobacteraceae bacterium]|jgi:hypothetical protein|nr:hypothetical protein [Acetobacteraceae bacterium]MEA2789194.1 hypothetical protein [Acetobacteraceae bacterium]
MAIGTTRLSKDVAGIVQNEADYVGDDFQSMTPAEREIRAETVNIILGLFKRGGDFTCTKVRSRRENVKTADGFYEISGYVTMLQFVNHCTILEMEARNGMMAGLLRNGVDIFFVDQELAADQIAPRYTTQWSAGVSPRDLLRVGARYHDSYPASTSPIFQAVIFRNRPARGRLIATLNYSDTFDWAVGMSPES